MRPPRRWFAAPLVVTVAAPLACSSGSSGSSGGGAARKTDLRGVVDIDRNGTACLASRDVDCPPEATCNPPPPRAVECPAGMGEARSVRIATAPDGACALIPEGCDALACGTPTACIDPYGGDGRLAPLQWAVNPADDGRCTATPGARTDFDYPGPPVAIECPLPERHGFIERATPDGPCHACAKPPCDPETAVAVACPPPSPP